MKKQTEVAIRAHVIRGASYLLLLVAAIVIAFFGSQASTKHLPRTLSFAERVSYQRAIEDVYWRHRIWPKENPNSKPSLEAVMSQAQLEKKVEDYLLNSEALEDYYKESLSAEQLQAEMDRMAQHTKQPEVLRELFEVLSNDPFVVAECLARPVLAERIASGLHVTQTKTGLLRPSVAAPVNPNYTLPRISDTSNGCMDDTWTPTTTSGAPHGRYYHAAVWTGTEMIVWGGNGPFFANTGGRYNPSTDSWIAITTEGAPTARANHTAVWTGTEMIVWGGIGDRGKQNTGGRYNPITDSWVATNINGAAAKRWLHTAMWSGTEMIVWGGSDATNETKTGGRYNPSTDSWLPTTTTGAPIARLNHTAVWTGTEMVIWGGSNGITRYNTGGRYNPGTDSWIAITTTGAPDERSLHTAVWTGTEMIVWGGGTHTTLLNTGGRYNPISDTWIATNITNAPGRREGHTAVWTGTEMIVWGGIDGVNYFNTGKRYDSTTDSWTATSSTNVPPARVNHTAVWTGGEMIVWGGRNASAELNTGGRYCARSGAPTPTPTPTPGPIQLRGQGKKIGGINTSRLKWRGATSANIDVYRDGVVIATTPNDSLYDDSTGTIGQASFTYQVCEAGTSTCSNEVVVTFP